MQEFVNERCRIFVEIDGNVLNFKGLVTKITDAHLFFKDLKEGKDYMFALPLVMEISQL